MSEEQGERGVAPDGESGAGMHIHRPKPLHGPRELLIEIAVIVVGIVIALGGEQAIEWLHRRQAVAETREALDRELAADLGILQTRIDEDACIARRLDELKQVFMLHARGAPLALKAPLGQPQFPHLQTSVWETALASEGTTHMPLDLKLRYAALYDALNWFKTKTTQESEAWSHLGQFDDVEVMDEADWSALRQWKAAAQSIAGKVSANIQPFTDAGATRRPVFDAAMALGVTPAPYRFVPRSQAARDAFCRPML